MGRKLRGIGGGARKDGMRGRGGEEKEKQGSRGGIKKEGRRVRGQLSKRGIKKVRGGRGSGGR